jgi:hypothetical protein
LLDSVYIYKSLNDINFYKKRKWQISGMMMMWECHARMLLYYYLHLSRVVGLLWFFPATMLIRMILTTYRVGGVCAAIAHSVARVMYQ